MKVDKIWQAETVVCIASGPSLTKQDCDQVRGLGFKTIAVNNAWELAPWCDAIYACDPSWWKNNFDKIKSKAERWTCFENAASFHGINCHGPFLQALNSGLRAVEFAVERGANRVVLLGYDCSVKFGTHYHGDHEETTNPNADSCKRWDSQFSNYDFGECEIINCSRYTELSCFKLKKLEEMACSLAV